MQTNTLEKTPVVFKDFPPALPPAKEEAALSKRRRVTVYFLIRALCLAISLSVITLLGVRKASEIFSVGITNYIGGEMLGISMDVFGKDVNEIAFGENKNEIEKDDTPLLAPLPSIHYIPLEDIKNEILLKEKLHASTLDNLYSYDTSGIPEGTNPIVPTDVSADSPLSLKNNTDYTIDMNAIAKRAKELPSAKISGEPLVLIVHTHGTESFANDGVPYYNDKINYPRSENVSENIVAVGKVLCDMLNENGIPTIQCETMHDKESYINAYDRTAASIKYYIEKYPSIQYIFDIHRDSLIRSDLTKLKPVTLYGGKPCAQIMMLVGSNEKGAPEYDWQSNLVLAEALQAELFESASGVARQLNLRGATYNQQYAKHGLLVEIGSCGNTLDEAKNAAKAFGDALIEVLKQK